jgi:hypothetical protein
MEAKSSGRKIIIISSLIILVVISLTFLIFNYTYSEGNRAGVVVKFSKKGYLLKTYEGELNMGGMGNLPNTAQMNMQWNFSVNDQAVADTLMNLEGRKVSLHYKEIIKNMPWQGETKYFVDGVKLIKD